MSDRLISPLKRKNSSQYWFRMVVPPRYREQVGKAKVKQSLGTDDLGEARRLCAARQHDWLKKFELIELELKAREVLEGTDAIDSYLDRLSIEPGSMDKAVSYELEGIALAAADHLEALTLEDLGLKPGDSHPLVAHPIPPIAIQRRRRSSIRGVMHLRTIRKAALSGREAVERARHLDFLPVTQSTGKEAFEAAGIDQLMLRIGGGDVATTKAWLDDRLKTIPVTDDDARARCARYDRDPPVLPAEINRPALLVFHKIDGFRDGPSVDAATAALKAMAQRKGWTIIFSDKGAVFNRRDLARFDAVVWNNVSGDVLTVPQEKAFQAYLAKGGGYAGIHGAGGDPTYIWDWYADKLLGARSIGHPMTPQFQEARVVIDDKSSVIARGLGDGWTMTEEWYSFDRSPRASGARIIARLDESSYNPVGYQGGDLRMGDHPIAWSRCIGNGRVFYSATGHHREVYSNASNLTLMENGISWAMGLEPSLCRDGKERPRQATSRTAGK